MSFQFSAVGTKDQVVAQLRKYDYDPFGVQVAQLLASTIDGDSKIEKPRPDDYGYQVSVAAASSPTPEYENAYVIEATGHRGGGGQASNLNVTFRAHSVPAAR